MLPARIEHVVGETYVFEQDNAIFHRAKDTIKLLQQETPDFTGPDLWPPISPDLSLVDCKVCGVMQQISPLRDSSKRLRQQHAQQVRMPVGMPVADLDRDDSTR